MIYGIINVQQDKYRKTYLKIKQIPKISIPYRRVFHTETETNKHFKPKTINI